MRLQLFLKDSKWYGNEFPEVPPVNASANKEAIIMRNYEVTVEKAKAEALEIVNEDLLGANGIIAMPAAEGVLYPWDGGAEIDCKKHSGIKPSDCHRCMGTCQCPVLRLLPKSPVISEYQDGEGNDIPRQSGIAAIGVPEFGPLEFYRCTCEASRARGIYVMCFFCDEEKIPKDIAAPVNDAGGGKETFDRDEVKHLMEIARNDGHKDGYKLGHLEAKYEAQEEAKAKAAQPSPQAESQEILWKRAMQMSGSQMDPVKWLADNFIITKQPTNQ